MQIPIVPEWLLSRADFNALDEAFTQKGVGMCSGTMSETDREWFKQSFARPGEGGGISGVPGAAGRQEVAPSVLPAPLCPYLLQVEGVRPMPDCPLCLLVLSIRIADFSCSTNRCRATVR